MADKTSLLHLKHKVFIRDVHAELLIMLNLVSRIFLSTNPYDEPISQAIRGTAGRDIVPKVLVLISQYEDWKTIVEFAGFKRLFHDNFLLLGRNKKIAPVINLTGTNMFIRGTTQFRAEPATLIFLFHFYDVVSSSWCTSVQPATRRLVLKGNKKIYISFFNFIN